MRPPIVIPAILLPVSGLGGTERLEVEYEVLSASGVYVTVLMTEREGMAVSVSFSASDDSSRVRLDAEVGACDVLTVESSVDTSSEICIVSAVTTETGSSLYSGRNSISPKSLLGHWFPCLQGSDSQQPKNDGSEA